jgi:hypothetical protein
MMIVRGARVWLQAGYSHTPGLYTLPKKILSYLPTTYLPSSFFISFLVSFGGAQ